MDWRRIHRYQERDSWCGVAVVQMVLRAAGIRRTQSSIARSIYLPKWGTTHDAMVAYLSRDIESLGTQQDATLEDIANHLSLGHAVIVNWYDNTSAPSDGHYGIVARIDEREIELVDPSDEHDKLWTMRRGAFLRQWFDHLDEKKRIRVNRWMLWAQVNR